MSDQSFVTLVLLMPVFAVMLVVFADLMFWCFCWCFCKVEGYFQERFMQKILRNMKRLEEIAAASEEKAAAA